MTSHFFFPSVSDRHSAPVWQWSELCHGLEGMSTESNSSHLSGAWAARGVSIDTRTLVPGDIFVALSGRHHHGISFVDQAVAKGASAVIIDQAVLPLLSLSVPLIRVPDSLTALHQLARYARQRFQGRLLAITGSVGKTSVKEGIAQVMRGHGRTFCTPGNFNNHLGVALSLCLLPAWGEYGIFELGMNRPGEILPLATQVRPQAALVTHVVYQHGEAFDSLDGIVQEKGSIFATEGLCQGILPCDSSYENALRQCGPETLSWVTFGDDSRADIALEKALIDDVDQTTRLTIRTGSTRQTVHWPMMGHHTYRNALAMIAGSLALGAPLDLILDRLPGVLPAPGRGQILNFQEHCVIDESYNAAPAAMKAAIVTLAQRPCKGRRYVVLGDMKELGAHTEHFHRDILETLGQHSWQHVWLCGDGFADIAKSLAREGMTWSQCIDDVVDEIVNTLRKGDIILVKGSRSARTEAVIEAMRHRYGPETLGG